MSWETRALLLSDYHAHKPVCHMGVLSVACLIPGSILDGVVGTTYLAEPLLFDHASSQGPPRPSVNIGSGSEPAVLELHETVFYSPYYSNSGMLN